MNSFFSTRNIYIGAMMVMVSLIIYVAYTSYLSDDEYKENTLCPANSEYLTGINVVLIDRTENISDVQRVVLENRFHDMVEGSAPGEKFVIYEIVQKDGLDIIPDIEICNPGHGALPVISNILDEKRYNELFEQKLNTVFKRDLQIKEQVNSPVMEIIQAVAGINFSSLHGTLPMRLIIVSDLMQHSGLYSQYASRSEAGDFFHSRVFEQVAVPLDGVDVEVWYLPRFSGPSAQPQGHREFWNHYFTALNARSVIFSTVTGAGWGIASR